MTATFVFTDLVDSTAIAARIGPDAAEQLRQTHFRLLRGAVASSGGLEVKNLGDGLMVMYSSPSRALAGAVGMQQAIEHHNRSGGPPLGVRIGIGAGEAVEEDGDYFGDPVVVAARLCAAADGGQILTADVVRVLVGSHATQTFVEVGPLDLKGIAGAVDAAEVVWEPAAVAGSVPLPGRLVGAASDALFGFFGRGPELAALAEARKRARSTQRPQVVLVGGEAGMGKTALVAQAARAAHGEGATVLFGHTDEDLGVAYQPWIEALSTLVPDGDGARLVEGLPSAQQTALARLLPALSGSGARVADADTERLLLLEGAVELLAAASQEAAVLVVLDDLHWADPASLQLLRHLAAATTPMEVTVACAYRDSDLSRGDPLTKLLADLHREANVNRIALRGLEDTEVIGLLEAAAGHDLDDRGVGLAHALRRETDGNPFFTGEMLRHLGETGAIVLGDDGRWTVAGGLEDLGLPSSVRDVVGRRVERLGNETVRVLSMAAVIGRQFDITLLATLTDIDEDALVELVDAAVTAAVLVESAEGSHYRFAHALIQHALYDELSVTRRQRLHQRVAEALEAEPAPADPAVLAELARHWLAATRPVELAKALRYARLAGDAARDALAPEDAIRWYRQALDLIERQPAPDQRTRAELLTALGAEQRRAAHPEYRDTLVRAAKLAEQLDATDILLDAALAFSAQSQLVADQDAKAVAGAALDAMGSEDGPTRARVLAVFADAHDYSLEWREWRRLSSEALDLARRSGDDAVLANVILSTAEVLGTPERRTEYLDDITFAVRLADHLGDVALRAQSRFASVVAGYRAGDIAAVDTAIAELGKLSAELGLPYQRWQHALTVTGRLLVAGQPEQAEAANADALQAGLEARTPDALGVFGGILYLVRWQQGRLDELVDFFIDAARENPSIAALRATIPTMLCEVGRIDEARTHLAAEAANGFEIPYDYYQWPISMLNFADSAATVGDQAAARTLIEMLAPFDTDLACAAPCPVGALARPLARLATVLRDYDQAERWFATAHDIHARLQAPFFAALGRLDHADLCMARQAPGDLESARELATTVAATAADYGYAGLSKRAAKLLAEL